MRAFQISPYIPDLNLITYHAERQESPFSRVSPWTKASMLAVLIIVITVSQDPIFLLLVYTTVLALFILARLPVRCLFAWYTFPLLFVLSLVGVLAWGQPGTPVVSVTVAGTPLVLTDRGLVLVLNLALKTMVSVTFSLFFLMTTRYEHLSGIVSRIFPAPLDQISLMAYRYFFLTLGMIGAILMAFRSRGGSLVRGMKTQGALLAGIIGLVIIRSLDRAERVERAMASRGYRGTYGTATEIPRPSFAELGALFAFIAIIAGASLWGVTGGW